MTIMTRGSATESWRDLVREASDRACIRLAETHESYLVFTLLGHMRDAHLLKQTIALDALDGCQQDGAACTERWREIGDRCLLIAGLFPKQAQRRCVGDDYYASWGQTAYAETAMRMRSTLGRLYSELAHMFGRLVCVLRLLRSDENALQSASPSLQVDTTSGVAAVRRALFGHDDGLTGNGRLH